MTEWFLLDAILLFFSLPLKEWRNEMMILTPLIIFFGKFQRKKSTLMMDEWKFCLQYFWSNTNFMFALLRVTVFLVLKEKATGLVKVKRWARMTMIVMTCLFLLPLTLPTLLLLTLSFYARVSLAQKLSEKFFSSWAVVSRDWLLLEKRGQESMLMSFQLKTLSAYFRFFTFLFEKMGRKWEKEQKMLKGKNYIFWLFVCNYGEKVFPLKLNPNFWNDSVQHTSLSLYRFLEKMSQHVSMRLT